MMSFTDITARDLKTSFNVNFVGLQQHATLFKDSQFLRPLDIAGIFVVVWLPHNHGPGALFCCSL